MGRAQSCLLCGLWDPRRGALQTRLHSRRGSASHTTHFPRQGCSIPLVPEAGADAGARGHGQVEQGTQQVAGPLPPASLHSTDKTSLGDADCQ